MRPFRTPRRPPSAAPIRSAAASYGLDGQETEVQFRVSQMDVDPLLVRVRAIHRTLPDHPFPTASARNLPLEVLGGFLQRYRGLRLQRRGLGRALEPRTERQCDQPAPRQQAE